ncbi:PAS domain S-box protein [Desulfobulbus rhabdoformis]|uniref:PAS domain S-box protein n=1 Tax=Desulfobulbus rhabdoformis TaxID=34032 RepID=UPI001964832F|nr:PAS domain S-box protein [Desulfobulbus rhabdoformis]MBM9614910.1 PAS domain S-box protein [Desulfobulbus rhabdoformis]
MKITTNTPFRSLRGGIMPALVWFLLCSLALAVSLQAEARTMKKKAELQASLLEKSEAGELSKEVASLPVGTNVSESVHQHSRTGQLYQIGAVVKEFRSTALLFLAMLIASLAMFQGRILLLRQRKKLAKQEETFLLLREQKRSLMQSPWTGLILVNNDAQIIELNAKASFLTGWSQEEAQGKPVAEVMTLIDQRGNLYSPMQCTPADSEQLPMLLTRAGEELHIALEVAPYGEHLPTTGGWIIRFRDQSDVLRGQQRVESRLLLREYCYTHGITEFLHRAIEELARLVGSSRGVCCSLEPPIYSVAVEQRESENRNRGWSWYDAGAEPICRHIQSMAGGFSTDVQVIDPSQEEAVEQSAEKAQKLPLYLGEQRELLLPLVRAGRLVAVIALADKGRPYSRADIDTVVELGEYIWRLVEQKHMEEDLLASERRYRSLYSSMMDAFVVTDLKGRIRECNQAYADMVGLSPEAVKGRIARDFTPEKWQQYEYEHVRKQLMHGGCSELYEKEYRHQDGHTFPVELRTYLLVNNEGQPEGMSAVVRDIRQRKQVQAEREKLRDHLNLAKKLESVGQLAGGVAHDFNNMLGVIIGFAELAQRRMDLPEPLDMYLQEITTAAKRSADVTRQLLTFARQQTIAPKVLELNTTLDERLSMLRQLIGEKIELCWQPEKNVWPIKMDLSQLDQILVNLVVNARDAINGVGIVTLEITRASFDETNPAPEGGLPPGDYVVLAVSDTGSGIDSVIADRIFEPFFTTKAQGQGTGLGLATVYGIVQQNHGVVRVQSEVDGGSTFRVYLPRYTGEGEEEMGEERVALAIGQGELVLVVEEEPAMLSLHQTILEQLNYKVLTAKNPDQALKLAQKHRESIDLVLLDQPKTNERELARKIGELCPQGRVVFLSANGADARHHATNMDFGATVLSKPFSVAELAQHIRAVLQ